MLDGIVASFPPKALSKDPAEAGDLSGIDYEALRSALIALSYFGLPGAFPKNALLPELAPDATDEATFGFAACATVSHRASTADTR